ncbi:hypothetical protein [Paracoccus aestuariivivens]|uniref:DUF1236 domain-containing protein n=1 Tax=Paracoccus aestuariivivens TaxID=1820333 RepID=A0A6L6JJ10_9RHOB|nr:hypothetical protein [Paracoccus aestuariivivens]MTH80124.1 hypothetical protein [Paracoccus aestuariivivens]
MQNFLNSVAVTLTIAMSGSAMAAPVQQSQCSQQDRNCANHAQPQKREQSMQGKADGNRVEERKSQSKVAQVSVPKRGEDAKQGRSLKSADTRSMAKPGAGRDYRVVNDRVVLVDSETNKIVEVMGKAADLLK